MRKPILALAALLFLLAAPVAAQTADCPPYEGITCEGWVTDAAGVLTDPERLEAAAARFVEETGHEIAVVTVDDTGRIEPRRFAEELGNAWGVGDAREDDGVVVLVALAQRRTEIVTGPGARLDDSTLSSVASLGNDFFANGDFDGGLAAILAGLQQQYAGGGVAGPAEPQPDGASRRPGLVVPLVGLGVLGLAAGGAVFVNRRNNRQERLAEHRRVVDQVLARLEPAGHEVVLPDDLLLPAPPADSAPDPDTAVAVEALANPETAEASVLEGLWAREALAVGNETKITEYRQMPLEMRISGEQELLEGAVRAAAQEAAEDPDPETFAVKRQNLAEFVESLRPYRIAEASTRLAREVSMRAVDTPIGPVIVTELGERILDAAPALRKEAPLSESIAELQQVAEEAAQKTELLEELYAKLPDSPSRPAVAAALADLGADPDEATRRYNAVLETLRRSSTTLLQDGIDLPSLAAFLVMNNDEDDIDEFI